MNDNVSRCSHLLRNTSVRELVNALLRDGFLLERETRSGGRIYRHPDGRITVIHYHHSSDTLTRQTLRSVVEAIGWTEDDLRRLRLIT
ncbi:MAG: type II toxin-antitoxin system HicA family toxin [Candidatus Sungbacteria bacterium]|nr:type II toxin-antitoxin system HicA family toxin [Candidatus Sungbacteria bacterium]